MGSDIESCWKSIWITIISIHAPRMGSDIESCWKSIWITIISIHAPRMGSDQSDDV